MRLKRNVKREDLQNLKKLDIVVLIVDDLLFNAGYKANINQIFEMNHEDLIDFIVDSKILKIYDKITVKRFNELNNLILKKEPKDFDFFSGEVEIVSIGNWGYLTVEDYESVFSNDRERREYQALSNLNFIGYEDTRDLLGKITDMDDDELNEELDDMEDNDDCIIFYTTSE